MMQPPPATLQDCKALLIDDGGTLYNNQQPIDGAVEFIRTLRRRDVPFFIFSNNTKHSQASLAQMMQRDGFRVSESHVLTIDQVLLQYLQREQITSVYVLGDTELKLWLQREGISLSEEASTILVGWDDQLTTTELTRACQLISNGSALVALHNTMRHWGAAGWEPSVGATLAFLTAVTGKQPDVVLGKPSEHMLKLATERSGVSASQLGIIGDRLDVDMVMAETYGLLSVLVLSGQTHKPDLDHWPYRPDYIVDSISNLTPLFI